MLDKFLIVLLLIVSPARCLYTRPTQQPSDESLTDLLSALETSQNSGDGQTGNSDPLWTRGTSTLPGWGNLLMAFNEASKSEFDDGHSNKNDALAIMDGNHEFVEIPDDVDGLDGYGSYPLNAWTKGMGEDDGGVNDRHEDHWNKEMSHEDYEDGMDESSSYSEDRDDSWDNDMNSEDYVDDDRHTSTSGYNQNDDQTNHYENNMLNINSGEGQDGYGGYSLNQWAGENKELSNEKVEHTQIQDANRLALITEQKLKLRQKAAAAALGQNWYSHPNLGQGKVYDHSIAKAKKRRYRKQNKYGNYIKPTEMETNRNSVAAHALNYKPSPVKITHDNLYGLGWGEWEENPLTRYSAARQKASRPNPYQFFNDPFLNDPFLNDGNDVSTQGQLFNRLRNLAQTGIYTGQWKDSLSRPPTNNAPYANKNTRPNQQNQNVKDLKAQNQKRTNQQDRSNPQHYPGSHHHKGQPINSQPPQPQQQHRPQQPPHAQKALQQQRPQQPPHPQKELQQRPAQQSVQPHKMLQQQQRPLQIPQSLQQLQQQQGPQQITQSQHQLQQAPQQNQLQYAAAQHGLYHHLPIQQQLPLHMRKQNFAQNSMQNLNMQNMNLPPTNLANWQQQYNQQMALQNYPYPGRNFDQTLQNPRQQYPMQNPQGSKWRNYRPRNP